MCDGRHLQHEPGLLVHPLQPGDRPGIGPDPDEVVDIMDVALRKGDLFSP
jgi:hypothetical protein